jgi:hypothetical protein
MKPFPMSFFLIAWLGGSSIDAFAASTVLDTLVLGRDTMPRAELYTKSLVRGCIHGGGTMNRFLICAEGDRSKCYAASLNAEDMNKSDGRFKMFFVGHCGLFRGAYMNNDKKSQFLNLNRIVGQDYVRIDSLPQEETKCP